MISKRYVDLAVGKTGMMFHFGRATVMVKTIEGSAPNFSQLIPQEPPLIVRVFAPELCRAVRRCANVAREGLGIIRLVWSDEALTVSARSEDVNCVEAVVKVISEGGPGKVAVAVNYLIEYLNDKDGLLTMSVTNEKSPVLFRYGSAPLVVIMPMMVE